MMSEPAPGALGVVAAIAGAVAAALDSDPARLRIVDVRPDPRAPALAGVWALAGRMDQMNAWRQDSRDRGGSTRS
ncbi:MAG TPA: hypothetical protein DEQ28_06870 [Clostridiales bacterium]|nr:hypothetical protein [Clostridiales bacterium]